MNIRALLPHTIAARLALAAGAATVAVGIAAAATAFTINRKAIQQQTDNEALRQVQSGATRVDDFLARVVTVLRGLVARQQGFGGAPDPTLAADLTRLLQQLPEDEAYALYVGFEQDGKAGKAPGRVVRVDRRGRTADRLEDAAGGPGPDWYRRAAEAGKPVIGDPFFDYDGSLVPLVTVSLPILDAAGKRLGVAAADISLDRLRSLAGSLQLRPELDDPDDPADDEIPILAAASGRIISHPDKSLLPGRNAAGTLLADTEEGRQVTAEPTGIGEIVTQGVKRRVYWATAPMSGWRIVLSVPESAVLGPVHAMTARASIMGPCTLVVMVIAVYIAARRISCPLGKLTEVARAVEAGDYRTRDLSPVDRRSDELGQLGRGFRRMIQEVAAREERLRKAEETVRFSERKFRSLIENAADIITVFDRSGTILYESPSVRRVLGQEAEARIGAKVGEKIHPDDRAFVAGKIAAAAASPGLSEAIRFRVQHKDGSYRVLEGTAYNLLDDPTVGGIVANSRDITDKVRADEEQAKLAAVIQNSTDFVAISSMDGKPFFYNAAARKLLGFECEKEALATPLEKCHASSSWRRLTADVMPEVLQHGSWEGDLQLRRHDNGEPVDVHANIFLVLDPLTRRPMCLATVMRDITEKKRAETELRRLAALIANSSDLIGLATPDGRQIFLNEAGRRLVGFDSLEEALSTHISEGHPPEDWARMQTEILPAVIEKGHWDGEIRLIHRKTRKPVDVQAALFVIRDPEGTGPSCLAAVMRDITDRRRAERFERERRAAEAANKAKSEFLANMSHELRTPMNGIIGMTELALDTGLTAEQREYLTLVRSSADALLTLLNDILDFSKIEAGRMELENVGFALRDGLGDTMHTLAVRAHQKGLELACRVAPDVPDSLVGDAGRLRQILVNLVGNAIKFTERGEVTVCVEREPEAGTGGEANGAADGSKGGGNGSVRLRFSVCDTGIGIPEDKREVIFRPFVQADGSTTRKYGGTGLGLSISRQLVELMGGTIAVNSEVGKGSTFHFTARFGVGPQRAEPPEPAVLRDLPVLVADDNATNRRILHDVLSNWRMRPTAVDGAAAALAELRSAAAAGRPFALLITDMHMPEADGLSLVADVRADPAIAATGVLVLTSSGMGGEAARFRELGVLGLLTKPVKQSALLDAILGAVAAPRGRDGLQSPGPAAAADPAPPAGPSLRVLLAEDTPVNQKMAVRLLEKRGHRVAVAETGKQAIAALERERFDVVLMDVQMPEMDGLEATGAIRAAEAAAGARRIPIIAMTAHAMKGDRERCLAAGMDGYLSKPIEAAELWRALAEAVPAPAAEAPASAESGGGDGAGARPAGRNGNGHAGGPSVPAMNRAEFLKRMDGDMAFVREVVGLFTAEGPKLVAQVREAVNRLDCPAVEKAAHALKGSLANFCAPAAVEAARRLEQAGRECRTADAVAALPALEHELERLAPELAAVGQEGAE